MGATSVIHIEDSQGSGPAMIFDVNNQRDIISHYDDGTLDFKLMSDGYIYSNTGWKYRYAAIGLGDIAANNDAYTYPLFRARNDITITHCSIGADTTVAADATNYQTIYLEQTGNSTDLSSLATSATGFTIHEPRDFTIATTADQDHLAAGDILTLRFVKASSGMAISGVTVSLTYTIDAPMSGKLNDGSSVGTTTDNVIRIINDIGSAALIQHDSDCRDHLSVRQSGVERFRIDNSGKMHGGTDYYPPDQYYYHVTNAGDISNGDTFKIPLFNPHCDVKIHKIYFGSSQACAVDSNTAYWQLIVKDENAKWLTDAFVHGPYGGGTALTAGYLYDMGDIAQPYNYLDAAEHIQVELVETGTASTIYDATFVVVYTKEN